jgi:glutaredoxin
VINLLKAKGFEPDVVDVADPGCEALLRRMQTGSGALSVPVLEIGKGSAWYVGYSAIHQHIKGIK